MTYKIILETIICFIVCIGIAYIISGIYLYFESLIKMKVKARRAYKKKKYKHDINKLLEELDKKEGDTNNERI